MINLLIIILGFICIGASNYECTVIKVMDGDTIRCEIETWPGDFKRISIRVLGIDTPEKNFPLGKVVKQYTIDTIKNGMILTLNEVSNDKYAGRALAEVNVPNIGDWTTHLISKGYAKPYFGESKEGLWKECELNMVEC